MTQRRYFATALLPAVLLAGCVAAQRNALPQSADNPSASVALPAGTTTTAGQPAGRGAPNPLRRLSLTTGAAASSGDPAGAVSGDPTKVWTPETASPSWVAIPLQGPAPETLVLTWNAAGFAYLNLEATPCLYHLSVSADSTDGVDGTWRHILSVTDNPVRARAETFQAPGARWVKLSVDTTWNGKLALRDLLVYGTSARTNLDSWHICGDSISDGSFNAVPTRDFARTITAAFPDRTPVVIDGATPSDNAQMGIEKLTKGLPFLPPGGYVAIAFGTNDCAQGAPLETYRTRMQTLIDLVRKSGRTPMLARIPWFPNPKVVDYVAVVDELTAANKLSPGPDLYTWFKTHPEELGSDQIHPTATGRRSIQRLWGEAAVRAYRGT